jgi:hypothetical protein
MLPKDRVNMTAEVIPTQGTVFRLATEAEGAGHKVFMELFFFVPVLLGPKQHANRLL